MSRTIRLTERDLSRIVKRVINEEMDNTRECTNIDSFMKNMMGNSGSNQFIVKTVPGKEDFLLLVDPNGKECYCTKEDFAVAGGI
jgi:hypothetical protein